MTVTETQFKLPTINRKNDPMVNGEFARPRGWRSLVKSKGQRPDWYWNSFSALSICWSLGSCSFSLLHVKCNIAAHIPGDISLQSPVKKHFFPWSFIPINIREWFWLALPLIRRLVSNQAVGTWTLTVSILYQDWITCSLASQGNGCLFQKEDEEAVLSNPIAAMVGCKYSHCWFH